jgi:hypothetical protein
VTTRQEIRAKIDQIVLIFAEETGNGLAAFELSQLIDDLEAEAFDDGQRNERDA